MKIWLSGSLLGDSGHGFRKFEAAANRLREKGHEVATPGEVQPWQHDGEDCPGPMTALGHAQACFMRTRIPAMLQCDAVLLDDYWYDDRVERIERRAAIAAGLVVYKQVNEVPFAVENPTTDLKIDPGTAEIIAEIKMMEYSGEVPAPNENEGHPTSVCRDEYERGLSDGEDAFWRKLGEGIMRNGHSELRTAVRLGELAVAPPGSHPRSDPKMETLARRMHENGLEFIKRESYAGNMRLAAIRMLRQMILYVTGKDVEE